MREPKSPGRPRAFDKTEILRKIMTLFWRGGYEGVSLSDIMAETGLRKASLYAAYGDKRGMYMQALAQYESDVVKSAARHLKDSSLPAADRIQWFLSAPLEGPRKNDQSGCFLCNASADRAALSKEIAAQVQRGFDILSNAIASALSELRPTADQSDVRGQAWMLLTAYSGLRVMARSGLDIKALEAARDTALGLIYPTPNHP